MLIKLLQAGAEMLGLLLGKPALGEKVVADETSLTAGAARD